MHASWDWTLVHKYGSVPRKQDYTEKKKTESRRNLDLGGILHLIYVRSRVTDGLYSTMFRSNGY